MGVWNTQFLPSFCSAKKMNWTTPPPFFFLKSSVNISSSSSSLFPYPTPVLLLEQTRSRLFNFSKFRVIPFTWFHWHNRRERQETEGASSWNKNNRLKEGKKEASQGRLWDAISFVLQQNQKGHLWRFQTQLRNNTFAFSSPSVYTQSWVSVILESQSAQKPHLQVSLSQKLKLRRKSRFSHTSTPVQLTAPAFKRHHIETLPSLIKSFASPSHGKKFHTL